MTRGPYIPEKLDNPATGDSATIERSALFGEPDTSIVFTLPAQAIGAPPHHHGSYCETFSVIAGALEVRRGPKLEPVTLTPGAQITIGCGEIHAFRNASDHAAVVFRVSVAEGAGFEQFVRAWYGLGRSGLFAGDRPRNPLHLALALDAGDINLAGVPVGLQKLVRRSLIGLAKLTGVDSVVTKHWRGTHV
ncbi:MAG: cupin domain-containing protein [Rhodospirillaceae bacterium]|nr:cupin domain-containing protein [Rhodospirillaceae bacterium]